MATEEQVKSFINKLGKLAVAEANRRIAAGQKFVWPSVCIAQAAHETGWGTSSLMTKANAYFGIKAGGSWTGKVFTAGTWEVAEGEAYNTTANFRAYDNVADSVADYYDLILNNSRYSRALSSYPDDTKSAYDTLYEIWAGGYATDEEYVPNVYSILTGRNLVEWDLLVDGKTFDPSYEYTGGTGGSSGSVDTSGYSPLTYQFEKVEPPKLHVNEGVYVPGGSGAEDFE